MSKDGNSLRTKEPWTPSPSVLTCCSHYRSQQLPGTAKQQSQHCLTHHSRNVQLSIISILSQSMVTDDCTQQFHVDVKQNWKSTDPWMTPKRRGQRSDLLVSINTNWNWPWRKEINQTTWCPVIPSPKAVPEEYYGQWYQKPLRDQVEQGWIHYCVLFLPDNIRSVTNAISIPYPGSAYR